MDHKLTLAEYIQPFSNVEQYVKAIYIINKKYTESDNNNQEILIIFKSMLNIAISVKQLDAFIWKIKTYTNYYSYDLISNFGIFEQEVINFSNLQQEISITLTPTINHCFICGNSKKDWFEHKNERFHKKSILYTTTKISNNYYFIRILILK